MNHPVNFALVLALLAFPACRSQPTKPSTRPAPAPMGWTGVLQEEEFKKLHELKQEQAPVPRGTFVDLAGSRAYLSLPPEARPPLAAITVIHEWWGLNDNILHWTDRLAADGYAALAVDLYGGKIATNPDEAAAFMRAVEETRSLEVLKAAHAFLANDPRVQARRRGVVGWCFGGGWSLQMALHVPDLDAAVIYYGRLVDDPTELRGIRAQLLGIFGNQDRGIPPAAVDAFEQGLKEAGVNARILRYDANHAFANPSSARYDEKSAAAAWEEVRRFLAARLK